MDSTMPSENLFRVALAFVIALTIAVTLYHCCDPLSLMGNDYHPNSSSMDRGINGHPQFHFDVLDAE